MAKIAKCPGCDAAVAEEGNVCGDCLDTALGVVLAVEEEEREDEGKEE